MDITQYLEWQKQGQRSIKLEADYLTREGAVRLWCYDYTIMCGATVEYPDPPPTEREMKEKLAARLRAELAGLEDET